jgi:hypothetical protein
MYRLCPDVCTGFCGLHHVRPQYHQPSGGTNLLTDKKTDGAKAQLRSVDAHHEHNDCIRIAYEWLDAQVKTKAPRNLSYPLKHLIEKWAGRYVSTSDVEVAAILHPQVHGRYPSFNISSRLTEPSVDRLKGIAQANTQGQRERHDPKSYKLQE